MAPYSYSTLFKRLGWLFSRSFGQSAHPTFIIFLSLIFYGSSAINFCPCRECLRFKTKSGLMDWQIDRRMDGWTKILLCFLYRTLSQPPLNCHLWSSSLSRVLFVDFNQTVNSSVLMWVVLPETVSSPVLGLLNSSSIDVVWITHSLALPTLFCLRTGTEDYEERRSSLALGAV